MNIVKNSRDKFKGTVPDYIASKLRGENEDGPKEALINAISAQEALGRLCNLLAEKEILTAGDIMYIAEDFRSKDIKFLED